jgi:para-nitrobenzyl esterase
MLIDQVESAMKRPIIAAAAALCAAGILVAGSQLSAVAGDTGRPPPPDLVVTSRGPVRGVLAADHRAFWGIPYATAARFTAPEPAPAWTSVRDATTAGPACAQAQGNEVGIPSTVEDCLNLNVFTPADAAGRSLPVMMWIHGGSFKYGAGSMYDAGRFATANRVIVVTVNYRLGLLGSLAHPALDDADGTIRSGTYGLQDQQAALRWVRDNARPFGGDPRNVTLLGESAGAYNTCAQLASPTAAGLFQRVVMQSAPCGQTWATSRKDGQTRAAAVADKLGCGQAADVATCLRSADITTLLKITEEYPITPPVVGGPLLPLDPTQALKTGRFTRVPVIQGINHDEYQLIVAGTELFTGHVLTADEYRALTRAEFGADADKVLAAYPLSNYAGAAQALAAVKTDHEYAYGATLTSTLLSRYVPTYAYEFAEQDTPWFVGLPRPSFTLGAYHLLDVAFLFRVTFIEPLSTQQQAIATDVGAYWAAFARTGTPNPAELPQWPRHSRISQYTHSLSSSHIGGTDFRTDHHYDLWNDLAN